MNTEAVRCAQSYIEYSGFSESGLLDQLLYFDFTQEQSEYGLASVGYWLKGNLLKKRTLWQIVREFSFCKK